MYVAAPDQETSIPELLRRRATATPAARFLSVGGEDLSFEATALRAELAAAALHHLGIRKGEKVALMLPNCADFVTLWFGASLLGAVLVPINSGLKGDGLRYILEHSDSKLAVVDEAYEDAFEEAAPAGAGPSLRLVRGRSGAGSLAELLAGGYADPGAVEVAPADLASILYTSGTTGRSKGVMNPHNAFVTAAQEFCRGYVRVREDDSFFTSLPLFHVNAQMLSTMGSLLSGRPLTLSPRFSASGFLDEISESGATVFNYIGAMLTMVHKQPPSDRDVDNPARLAIGGAAPATLWRAFEQRFGLSILEIYGLTETATFCLGSPPDDIRVGKLGRPTGWAEVRIAREDGSEAEAGEAGEIVIRGRRDDVLFDGYYKNESATAEAMGGGWFHSGDRGRRDPDGYFVFLDRLKDVIRRRGENVSSYEVERIVNAYPGVAESAAIGVPSELGEEDVMVVVVPRDGSDLDPSGLVDHCARELAGFMVPRYVRLVGALPKTATERVQKFVLRDQGLGADAWDREAAA